jgi:hypothetical protein
MNTEKRTQSNIHALSGIQTHDPGFRTSDDSTCPRPLDYHDRQILAYGDYVIHCIGDGNICEINDIHVLMQQDA